VRMLVELQTRDRQEWLPTFTPSAEILKEATPAGVKKEGYYGLPMLKRPTWSWEIASYFFLEGVSAGSFLMASLAARSGDKRLRPVTRAGHYTALLAFIPCPPLLIADLGDPSRFHHMLRVFKPSSPMNLGALFATSAINNGVAATSLHLALHDGGDRRALRSLEKVERVARLSEAIAIGFYLATTGKAAKPLMKGRYGRQFWLGAVGVGLVAPAVLQAMRPKRRKQSRVGTILRSALSLAGGFALKWAIVHAGRASAEDVESARHASRPSRNAPGWGPRAESRR